MKLEKMLKKAGVEPTKKETKPSILFEDAHNQAMRMTRRQNKLEDKLAKRYYGVSSWDDLDYDQKEEITYLAMDILDV